MDALGVKQSGSTDNKLTVELAKFLDILEWYLHHPDTGYQIATSLGFTGAALGLIGVLISIIGLFT